ncbi:MAG: MFS transporter [Promethearchaeia archaeon]
MKKQRITFLITIATLYVLITLSGAVASILSFIKPYILSDPQFMDVKVGMLGFIIGFSTLTMAGFGILFGYLSDSIKRVYVAFIGSLIMAIADFLTAFAQNYTQLFLFQIIGSIGYGSTTPIMFSIFSDIFSPEKRSTAFAWLSIVTGVLGGLLGSIIIVNIAAISWRMPYFYMGIITAIFTPLIPFIPEPKRGESEKELQVVYEEDPTLQYLYKIKIEDLKYLWKRPTNLFLILNFVDNVAGGIILTYAIDWLYFEHGVSPEIGILAVILIGIFAFLGTISFAKLGDKKYLHDKKIRIKLGIILSIAEAPFIIIAFLLKWKAPLDANIIYLLTTPIILLTIILMGFAMFFDSGIYPNWMSAITEVNLPEQRGTMISLANFCDAAGRALGIFIGAILIDTLGFTPAMEMAAVFTIISFIWWIPGLKYVKNDIESVKRILRERAEEMKNAKSL